MTDTPNAQTTLTIKTTVESPSTLGSGRPKFYRFRYTCPQDGPMASKHRRADVQRKLARRPGNLLTDFDLVTSVRTTFHTFRRTKYNYSPRRDSVEPMKKPIVQKKCRITEHSLCTIGGLVNSKCTDAKHHDDAFLALLDWLRRISCGQTRCQTKHGLGRRAIPPTFSGV